MVLFYSVGHDKKKNFFFILIHQQGEYNRNSFWVFAIECAPHWNVGGVLAFVYLYVSGK